MERPADSRSQPSLDEIVSHSAAAIADQIRGAAALAKSEMDLQIDVAGALKEFAGDAKITLEGHHNITIATGRPIPSMAASSSNTKSLARSRPTKTRPPTRR